MEELRDYHEKKSQLKTDMGEFMDRV